MIKFIVIVYWYDITVYQVKNLAPQNKKTKNAKKIIFHKFVTFVFFKKNSGTSAKYIQVDTDDTNNAFDIIFGTISYDSNGVYPIF